jgi:hypothetical protein
MPPKFKEGDRVVLVIRHPEAGMVVEVPPKGSFINVKEDATSRTRSWSIQFMELEHIFNSPLYQVLK